VKTAGVGRSEPERLLAMAPLGAVVRSPTSPHWRRCGAGGTTSTAATETCASPRP